MLKSSGSPWGISSAWILEATLLVGGRPVYSDLSLEELVQQSDLILVAEMGNPFPDPRDDLVWNFTVQEVLFNRLKRGVHSGGTIKIFQAGYDVLTVDRANRKGGGSGVSYPAMRYAGGSDVSQEKRFVIFVREKQSVLGVAHLEFTAVRAYESLDEKERIQKLLGSHTAPTP